MILCFLQFLQRLFLKKQAFWRFKFSKLVSKDVVHRSRKYHGDTYKLAKMSRQEGSGKNSKLLDELLFPLSNKGVFALDREKVFMTRNTVEDGVGDFCFVLRNLIGTEQSNRRREHIRFKGSFNLKKKYFEVSRQFCRYFPLLTHLFLTFHNPQLRI